MTFVRAKHLVKNPDIKPMNYRPNASPLLITKIMDWHLLGLSFITVFLSELGDKSQLAAIALSGRAQSRRTVFFATAGALVLTSLIGALAGGAVSELLPTRLLKAIAATGFIIIAVRMLWFNDDESEVPEESHQHSEG